MHPPPGFLCFFYHYFTSNFWLKSSSQQSQQHLGIFACFRVADSSSCHLARDTPPAPFSISSHPMHGPTRGVFQFTSGLHLLPFLSADTNGCIFFWNSTPNHVAAWIAVPGPAQPPPPCDAAARRHAERPGGYPGDNL